jgi:hypothetical protein
MAAEVLVLDIAGNPIEWQSFETVANHYATGKIAWELGDPAHARVLRGGVNARSGEVSTLKISPIVALHGSQKAAKHFVMYPQLPERGNAMLFKRDRYVCAYCGETFDRKDLTRDHVVPRSKGGPNTWENCVSACWNCNNEKDSRSVHDFRPLLFVPYAPCRNEQMILAGRSILADQMDYLAAKLPKHSRVRPH